VCDLLSSSLWQGDAVSAYIIFFFFIALSRPLNSTIKLSIASPTEVVETGVVCFFLDGSCIIS